MYLVSVALSIRLCNSVPSSLLKCFQNFNCLFLIMANTAGRQLSKNTKAVGVQFLTPKVKLIP